MPVSLKTTKKKCVEALATTPNALIVLISSQSVSLAGFHMPLLLRGLKGQLCDAQRHVCFWRALRIEALLKISVWCAAAGRRKRRSKLTCACTRQRKAELEYITADRRCVCPSVKLFQAI